MTTHDPSSCVLNWLTALRRWWHANFRYDWDIGREGVSLHLHKRHLRQCHWLLCPKLRMQVLEDVELLKKEPIAFFDSQSLASIRELESHQN